MKECWKVHCIIDNISMKQHDMMLVNNVHHALINWQLDSLVCGVEPNKEIIEAKQKRKD